MEARLARVPRAAARASLARLPELVAVVCAATAAVGLVLTATLEERAFDSYLGAPYPPLFLFWSPEAESVAAALAAALAFAVVVTAAPRMCSARTGPGGYAAFTFAAALGLRLVLAAARVGTDGWYTAFRLDPYASNEYLPSLPALDLGVSTFLDRFAELAPTLSLHPSAHPPGLLILLDALAIDTPEAMVWLLLVVGSAAAPLTYLLGRRLVGERRGRLAALLFVFSPSALIWGATSADALFATLGALAAVLLVGGHRLLRALGAAAFATGSLFAYSLLGVGAWVALVSARREGARAAALLSLAMAAALAGVYALLWAATGYDPLAALAAAGVAYDDSIAQFRPYRYWVFGSPAAFMIMLGLPIAWYALRAVSARQAAALALACVVVAAALGGYTKAETERIWLFLVPFACVAAAGVLPERYLRPVLALLAVQALAVELLFFTIW